MTCTGDGARRELEITAYLDGELDLAGVLDLERHLEECPRCAELLAAQRAMQQAIAAADLRYRPTLSQARRLRRKLGAPPAAAWWRQPQLRSLAALLLVAVGAVAGWSAGRRWPAPAAPGAGAAPAPTPAPGDSAAAMNPEGLTAPPIGLGPEAAPGSGL